MTDFKDTKIYTGEELAKSPVTQALSTGMASEQSQAIAKIQAALTIAAARPRDELGAIAKIVKSCQRKKVAEAAQYAYKRGGTLIEGPSIRLAQIIATAWGNIRFGFREVGGGKDYTEVEAFAWDLETNTEATRLFKVYHRRYTGDQKLTGERDKYENMASVAQRRVRACIEQVVPDDVFETAVETCNETLRRADPRSLEEKIRSMVLAFDKIGVSKNQLEGFLGHALTAAVEAQVITLGKVYKSIVDGVAKREDFFQVTSAVEEAKKRIEAAETSKKTRKPRSDKGKRRSTKTHEPKQTKANRCPSCGDKPGVYVEKTKSGDISAVISCPKCNPDRKLEPGDLPWSNAVGNTEDEAIESAVLSWNKITEKATSELPAAQEPSEDCDHLWSKIGKQKESDPDYWQCSKCQKTIDKDPNTDTDTELDEKIKSAAQESEFNPIEELYALADQLWGQTAGSQLAKVCEKHGIDLSQLTERDANLMIDVVAEQIEMTKGQNE